jgi:hypothetical protein
MAGVQEVAQAELNAAGGSLPPPPGRGQKVAPIGYDVVPGFIALPDGMYLGECSGVAVNSQGHVFVLSRGNTNGPAYGAAATQLLEFGSDGKFIREIGQHLYAWSFAHTVKVDRHDNSLGDGQGLGHGGEVYAGRSRSDAVRAKARGFR